ncbi:MAG: 2-polyprenyl-3-methyl-5-hydroxy-6-metoxy-1,4-benzoquinol methylase [Candidatus Brocadiaceae bacterium]|nr:2-polyprenyl-3-methyl-5-hydroxy-6-metoxy-1,4-benzoquinol methylase [Candidatus Brocadiaceae bacterium]MBM2834354.1 2-polyprenyl-3-methyl-5-hydroxy-6-metoxy-1,4-benzoquinol methylase [Candidatus Brocadiaceae bacterium]
MTNVQPQKECYLFLKNALVEKPDCFDNYQEMLFQALTILFQRNFVDLQKISGIAITQIKSKYDITTHAVFDPNNREVTFFQDTLVKLVLEKTICADIAFELFLTDIRRFILLHYRKNQCLPVDPTFVSSQALQCFNNEHIFNEPDDESDALCHITASLNNNSREVNLDAFVEPLLILSMYQPIKDQATAIEFARRPLEEIPVFLRPVIGRMVQEPLEEQGIAENIPTFGLIGSNTSKSVRAQYEENPYPRWVTTRGRSASVQDVFHRYQIPLPALSTGERIKVLVPGCGTGRHPISIAMGSPDVDIVAIDISKASLSYGKRMANHYGIKNITFLHGDILDLPNIPIKERGFHYIECAGVIHHMENQEEGWQAIENCLLPGGIVYVGVYSKAARILVTFLRIEIERLGLQPNTKDIKAFRSRLIHDAVKRVLIEKNTSVDLFTLSQFRDLFFHVSEHQNRLSQIEDISRQLKLKFLGFRITSPLLRKKYLERYPADPTMNSFSNWIDFEPFYVGSREMFHAWFQKR